MSGVVYRLTGLVQAHRSLAAARVAMTYEREDACLRLHAKFMRKYEIEEAEPSFGDDEFDTPIMRAHVGA